MMRRPPDGLDWEFWRSPHRIRTSNGWGWTKNPHMDKFFHRRWRLKVLQQRKKENREGANLPDYAPHFIVSWVRPFVYGIECRNYFDEVDPMRRMA